MPISLHAVRAATPQEAHDFMRVRVAFLNKVKSDSRTIGLFEFWAEHIRFADMIAAVTPVLDRAAARAGLDSRAAFRERPDHSEASLFDAIPISDERALISRCLSALNNLMTSTRDERTRHAQWFIVHELYDTSVEAEVPMRAWLADDVIRIYEELAACQMWDTPFRLLVPISPRVSVPPADRRGKRSGASLEQYVHWYYRMRLAKPRASENDVANERLDAMGNPDHAPRDYRDITERPDTKAIRYGVDKVDRLLRLAVPAESVTA